VEAIVGVAEEAAVARSAAPGAELLAEPLDEAASAAAAEAVPGPGHGAVPRSGEPAVGHRGLRILLAEDNPINQRVAELMLSRRGHQVDIVDNGADAVRAVHDVAYDLVLMDVRMPSMDGLEATERIRAYPPGHGAPRIVALTANATVDDQAAGRRAGMDGFLAKPIQETDLDVALAAAAGRADTAAALARPAEAAPTSEDDDVRTSVSAIAGADFANQVRLADILIAFARRLSTVLAEMDEALAEENHDRVDRLAHGLKGSAATLGAHRLANACARLEAYAQQHDAFGAGAALREVRHCAEVAERSVVTVAQELVAASA
jgi:CheY-like chemotaxis protein